MSTNRGQSTKMRGVTGALVGAALATVGVTGSMVAGHANPAHAATMHDSTSQAQAWQPPARAPWMNRACKYDEFVNNCAWNARLQGNGVGHSFYSVRRDLLDTHGNKVGRVVCVYYTTPGAIDRWDACHILPH